MPRLTRPRPGNGDIRGAVDHVPIGPHAISAGEEGRGFYRGRAEPHPGVKTALPTAQAGFCNSYGVAAGGGRRVTNAACSGPANPGGTMASTVARSPRTSAAGSSH